MIRIPPQVRAIEVNKPSSIVKWQTDHHETGMTTTGLLAVFARPFAKKNTIKQSNGAEEDNGLMVKIE